MADVLAVTVAVLTFRRPELLRAVLPLLLAQAAEVSTDTVRAEVLVVDNEPSGSARPVVDSVASAGLRYVLEPEPGIAAARNRALDETADSDLLVFIDDDERPHEGWLGRLLATWSATGAAGVAGAVVSEFECAPGPWLEAGEFFRRRRLSTGSEIHVAATNNLLLDLHQVRRAGIRFDRRFGSSGGEDTVFTRSLRACGARLVWCDDAVVTDVVPRERTTVRWVLLRAFSSGNSDTRVLLALARGRRARLLARGRAVARGLPRVAVGSARSLAGLLVASRRQQARGLRSVARGSGMLAGAFGHVYLEYRR